MSTSPWILQGRLPFPLQYPHNFVAVIEKGLLNTNGNPVKLMRGTVMRGIFINHDQPSPEIKPVKNLESMGSRLGTEVGMKLCPIAGTNDVSAKKRADTTQTQNENEMNTKTTEIGSELYTIADSLQDYALQVSS